MKDEKKEKEDSAKALELVSCEISSLKVRSIVSLAGQSFLKSIQVLSILNLTFRV